MHRPGLTLLLLATLGCGASGCEGSSNGSYPASGTDETRCGPMEAGTCPDESEYTGELEVVGDPSTGSCFAYNVESTTVEGREDDCCYHYGCLGE